MSGTIRSPAVAGTFYPADPGALEAEIDHLLGPAPRGGPQPKALIVPHAAYLYSGRVAGAAYARVPLQTRRVVLVGPAHFVPLRGLAVPAARAFRTPLGVVEVDPAAREALAALPQITVDDAPHAPEHSIEVQVPVLQRLLGDFRIVPLVAGRASPDEVAAALETVWEGEDTLIVVTSDLSHYHDHDTAVTLDRRTANAIVAQDVEAIRPEDACGATGLRGLLALVRTRGLHVELLDLRTSADAGGPRSSVVGYGAFAIR